MFWLFSGTSPAWAQDVPTLSDEATTSGLELVEVATDLPFPMGMIALDDGSLLVATSPSESGNFYDSDGEILRLIDSDDDGVFDSRIAAASGLPGSLVALAMFDELVIVTSAESGSESLIFLEMGETADDPLSEITRFSFEFGGALHQSYGLAVRQIPDSDDSFDVVFNVGAAGNDTAGPIVPLSGPISADLNPASIYLITVTRTRDSLSFDAPIQLASGLRNASALLFEPDSGDLLIGENGIDGFENPIVAFSADEINLIPADQIGSEVIDFGFPDAYTDSATRVEVGDESALVTFLPIDGDEAEGIAGIALLPDSFPESFAGMLIAGFHGQFDLIGVENEENPVRMIDLASGDQSDLIVNSSPDVGHVDSMVATEDAVYLADFCSGSLTSSTGCGIIYLLTTTDD